MGKVVACRDTDGDGKADKFVDFVQSVDSPRGGHFVGDTLYLIHPPFLSSFRDTTGDGVADEHKVLLENIGFGLRHPRGSDHTTNGCRMGIDGWLYIAGTVTNVKASEIRSRKQLGITMMPAGLTAGLTTAEFTSLIEYLVSLKEKK
jgi:glucose/arabinose dehydrogenase